MYNFSQLPNLPIQYKGTNIDNTRDIDKLGTKMLAIPIF